MEGWELDPATVIVASNFMGLNALVGSGAVTANVGDALGDAAVVEGGFAALIVDVFVEHALLPALTEEDTWLKLKRRLRPDGIVMVNLGLLPDDLSEEGQPSIRGLNAMNKVFGGAPLFVLINQLEYDLQGIHPSLIREYVGAVASPGHAGQEAMNDCVPRFTDVLTKLRQFSQGPV